MFKILIGHTAPNLNDFFQAINDSLYPAYNLRTIQTDLALPMPKKDFGKRYFNYME